MSTDMIRIIPARAGFTTSRPRGGGGRRDHPRSRGVYSITGNTDARTRRIIPARAGFTSRAYWASRLRADHPRSRGVYSPEARDIAESAGSSPLARGLRRRARAGRATTRIIPARAGFTMCGSAATAPSPDHPRSRGVYVSSRTSMPGGIGSSPLARGLPALEAERDDGGGIIPARAGFTRAARACSSESRDHPRSRGVYSAPTP